MATALQVHVGVLGSIYIRSTVVASSKCRQNLQAIQMCGMELLRTMLYLSVVVYNVMDVGALVNVGKTLL